jgi:hypothetical protein
MKKEDKIFTAEELIKVAELSEFFNHDIVARNFSMTPDLFAELKRLQPKLKMAYNDGVRLKRIRLSNERCAAQRCAALSNPVAPKLITITERQLNASGELQSNRNALDDFKKQFKENKERQLRRDLADLHFV